MHKIRIAFVTLLMLTAVVATSTPSSAEGQNIPVDPLNLSPVAERMWGVSGQNPQNTQTPTLDVLVWDFVQIGDRMFVGGAFLNVQENKTSAPIPQPYLAAFDLNTGDWISSFTPSFDYPVYALDATSNGLLLVGGEFTSVNGQPREGLVALNPSDGSINTSFQTSIERPWSSLRAQIRDIDVLNNGHIYIAGNFSHATGPNGRYRFYKVARITDNTGTVDSLWTPEVSGSGVWGIDVNLSVGDAVMAGYFSSIGGQNNTGYAEAVDLITGDLSQGKQEIPRNYPPSQPEFFDVSSGNNKLFVVGEQHIVQVLDPTTHVMDGYHITGGTNMGFEWTGGFAGGGYQVSERIGDWVFAGCHCTYDIRNGIPSHYSSYTNQRTAHKLVMAYDATTGHLLEGWQPDIHSPRDGTWAVAGDTQGCLWVGGDFHVTGVDSGSPHWLGGFGRFCPDEVDPPEPPVGDSLVDSNSTWSFHTGAGFDDTDWTEINYNDDNWATGLMNAGFNLREQQEFQTDLEPGYIAYYARSDFDFSGDNPTSLILHAPNDDGAIVYINGQEVLRDNMPEGPINWDTRPLTWKSGNGQLDTWTIPSDMLVQGTNTIAVQVHNFWAGNQDLYIDVELNQSNDNPPPVPPEDLIDINTTWTYSDQATERPAGFPSSLEGSNGSGAMGFGEPQVETNLTSGNNAYYFHTEVNISDPSEYSELDMSLWFDDGIIIYVNGQEVMRHNMPNGNPTHFTSPTDWICCGEENVRLFELNGAPWVQGTNTISVEVHNYWAGNSDLMFWMPSLKSN